MLIRDLKDCQQRSVPCSGRALRIHQSTFHIEQKRARSKYSFCARDEINKAG
ncbi:hypothetical protein Plhal304r1_c050g0133511 [Plasmopara halstedii]